ncbi:MAG: xanthine dehydrogenase family protein molybdopterin-binding subunit [Streptomycetales bacterium]
MTAPPGQEAWSGGLPRVEDARLVTGAARYVANLVRPDTLRAGFARSMAAHARLGPIHTEEARAVRGVVAVFTAADLDLPDVPAATGRGPSHPAMTRPPLARGSVRYVGEPLAVVVAGGQYEAADAVEMIWPEVEELPVVGDPRAAAAGGELLFPDADTNVVHTSVLPEQGDEPAPGSAWPVRARVEVENQRLAPAPLEALAVLAEPRADGGLVVWCAHQAPHRLRNQLSDLLGIPRDRLRVIVPDVGGAFGLKGMLFPEYVVVAAAALRLRRPVLWAETRREHLLGGTHGRGQINRVELLGERDGRIRAARVDILGDLGAYPHNGGQIPLFTRYLAPGPYAIPDLTVTTTMVVTNRAPTGSYRGAGRPEAAYAMERAIDVFAREAGLDPAQVRRRNLIRPEAMPYPSPTGALYDSGDYPAALDHALALAGADEVRAEQAARRDGGDDPVGLGIGAFVERAGGALGSSEYARVELDGSGTVVVRVGTAAAGQGHETTWTQLAAEALGVGPGQVRVHAGDTGEVADGVGSFGSRSAQVAGSAIWRTGTRLSERARRLAGELLEVSAADLVLQGGGFHVRGDARSRVACQEVAALAAERGLELAEEERYDPGAQTFPYGVHVAVVDVELATGLVGIRKLVAVDDCGVVLHPTIVEGQVHGSLMQGVGQALYESVVYDEHGQPLTSTLADYHLASVREAPRIVTGRLISPAPSNPLGVKGAGESGCIGAPPAVVNAVLDALAPYGVHDLQMPLSPWRVWSALRAARGGPRRDGGGGPRRGEGRGSGPGAGP